jgi:hypothetical protein
VSERLGSTPTAGYSWPAVLSIRRVGKTRVNKYDTNAGSEASTRGITCPQPAVSP